MIEAVRNWYRTKTVREQRLLLFAAGLLIIVISWLLIVRPMSLALDRTKERHDRAIMERAQVGTLIDDIAAAQQQRRSRTPGRIRDILDSETARAGFDAAQIETIGTDGVRIIIAAVRPQSFFAWVSDLEQRLGVDIEALTARPNADETLAVNVTFRGGG